MVRYRPAVMPQGFSCPFLSGEKQRLLLPAVCVFG